MGKVTREEHVTILTLRKKGIPVRRVAQMIGHSVTTVQKYAAIAPSDDVFSHRRASKFDSHKGEIESLLNADRGKQSHNIKTAIREFRIAHPSLTFGNSSFYDFVNKRCELTREPKLARIPLEHEYGEAQIDFCAVTYYRGSRRVNGRQFTMSFPHSGACFVQIFPAENQQCLFEGMAGIFEFIGFVPNTVIFDNASTAVLTVSRKGNDAVPTKEYADFAAYYGFEARFCNPASGWEKGCVERYNETSRKRYFTPPPRIIDEQAYNRTLLVRCMDDVCKDMHHLKLVSKAALFEHDRIRGMQLPKKRFDCYKTLIRKTDKCAMIQIKKSRYSVSDRHPRKTVVVKLGAFDVQIFDEYGKYICSHRRSYIPGTTTVNPELYSDALAARPRAVIKKSDNEYTVEILSSAMKELSSVRPAAKEDSLVEKCERRGLASRPVQNSHSLLWYAIVQYDSDEEDYDGKLQSNGSLVQTASARKSVCRSRTR